jgi:hypothetical protein
MDELDFEVIEQVTEEITARDSKSPLVDGFRHHNFSGVGSGDALALGESPLEHSSCPHEVILNEFEDFFFINGGGLEHLRARSGHGCKDGERWKKGEET